MAGDDQVPVILPAEPLRLALAAAVRAQLVKQARPVPGTVACHPGDADPAAARAADPNHRAGPARSPGAALRRPQPLACLVLEADEGAQVARDAFISGHTSAFHTATASSSRSMTWRTGTWQDQPCRRISFQTPSTVYPTWNSFPISVLIRPRVQRWSPANPWASGAFPQLGFQPRKLLRDKPLPRHRPPGLQCPGAAVPPGPPPPAYRPFGDPQVPGDLAGRVAAGESLSCLQPQPLAPLLLGRCVPAALRISHAPFMRRQPADITSRSLRVHLG